MQIEQEKQQFYQKKKKQNSQHKFLRKGNNS